MDTFVIAEIGVNHNGRVDLALELVEVAHRAGAQAAKFQTFKADTVAVKRSAAVAYQTRTTGEASQHELLRRLELGEEEHREIARRCRELGIEFMSTAFDGRSLDLLCDLGIRRIKVPSGEITNTPYLVDCAERGLPIVLSTGMATLEEVAEAVAVVEGAWARSGRRPSSDDALVVLHCTTAYPTPFEDVNLSAMTTMRTALGKPVGYSDHTAGVFVPPLAVALGARVIEKHITLDRGMSGPDHAASIEPGEFAEMVSAIRAVEALMGDGVKAPRPLELEARALVRRGLKAARDMPAGTRLGPEDVAILRPATGLPPSAFDALLGRTTSTDLRAGDPIDATSLS